MTDEEIEKALKRMATSRCSDVTNFDYEGAVAYIDRLKAEIAGLTGTVEALKTDNDNLTRTLEEANEELKERTDEADSNAALGMEQKLRADKLEEELIAVRKETAEEILQDVYNICGTYQGCENMTAAKIMFEIARYAQANGVEVKE